MKTIRTWLSTLALASVAGMTSVSANQNPVLDALDVLVNQPNVFEALGAAGNDAMNRQNGFAQGESYGRNEGFLEGYGAGTGMTPGPVEVPFGSGGGGGLGNGGSSKNDWMSPDTMLEAD